MKIYVTFFVIYQKILLSLPRYSLITQLSQVRKAVKELRS